MESFASQPNEHPNAITLRKLREFPSRVFTKMSAEQLPEGATLEVYEFPPLSNLLESEGQREAFPHAAELFKCLCEQSIEHPKSNKDEVVRKKARVLIAGGYVRDLVSGAKSPKDIDIACNIPVEQLKVALEQQFGSRVRLDETGQNFGVLRVNFLNKEGASTGEEYEIAHFRTDDSGSSKADTEVSLLPYPGVDAWRRDLTFNGLYVDVSKLGEPALLYDYVGGVSDIQDGIINFIGDPNERIREDATRIMRAFRFAAQLGYQLSETTLNAVEANKEAIGDIHLSPARIQERAIMNPELPRSRIQPDNVGSELYKLCKGPHAIVALRAMSETGVLDQLFPGAGKMNETPQGPPYHMEGNVWKHTLMVVDRCTTPLVRLAAILHDIEKPSTRQAKTDDDGNETKVSFLGHAEKGAEYVTKVLQPDKDHRPIKFDRTQYEYDTEESIKIIEWLVANHQTAHQMGQMKEKKLLELMYSGYRKHEGFRRFRYLCELQRADAAATVPNTHELQEQLTNNQKQLEERVNALLDREQAIVGMRLDGRAIMEHLIGQNISKQQAGILTGAIKDVVVPMLTRRHWEKLPNKDLASYFNSRLTQIATTVAEFFNTYKSRQAGKGEAADVQTFKATLESRISNIDQAVSES